MAALPFRVYLSALKRKISRLSGSGSDPYLPLPESALLSPSIGVAAAFRTAPCTMSFTRTPDEKPRDWQDRARLKLEEITGYQGVRSIPTVTIARDPVRIAPDIVRRSYYLRIRPDTDLPIHLIHAEGLTGAAPVFLHLAGSTSGVHLAWGEAKVPIDHQRLAIGADMARQAAKRGYLAVAIEQAGYGERMERHLPKRSADRTVDLTHHLLLLGRTLMGDGASDVSSAIDWLTGETAPIQVDTQRINLFGHSAGGTLAQFAAALDTRISGVLASGSVGPMRMTIGARGVSGGDGIVPGILNWFDSRDLVALVAPRNFVGLSGTDDHIFPAGGVEEVIRDAHTFYSRMNASERLCAVAVDGPHRYHAAASWKAWERIIDPG